MKPEEYLDSLIERREQGQEPFLIADDTVAAGLAAAQTLEKLNTLAVPPDFARRLERSIRLRTRELGYEHDGSFMATGDERYEFEGSPGATRDARFEYDGSLRATRDAHKGPNPISTPPASLQRGDARKGSIRRRAWIAAVGVAAALVLAWVGLLTISARSLPGDPLYGLRQATEHFRLNFSGSAQDRINAQFDQLHGALVDLSTVVSDRRSDGAISIALSAVADNTKSVRNAVAALPEGTDADTAEQSLQNALGEEDQTLRSLLNQVDWRIKVAFTGQLGVLGDPVPTITHVTVLAQRNGTLLITLTGTNFAQGVRLVVDGQAAGTVTADTPGQLTAVLSTAGGLSGEHEIGVHNPDGTAAEVVYVKATHDDGPGGNHSRYGTPTPGRGSDDNGGD